MKVSHLFIYPIKSCRGISLTKALISPQGLRDFFQPNFYDRQFMLVDEKGKFLTQRQYPLMATIEVKIKENKLYLSCDNYSIEDFELIPNENKTPINVTIWRDNTVAIDQGEEIGKWFKSVLNLDKSCYLVQQSKKYIRSINKQYSTAFFIRY